MAVDGYMYFLQYGGETKFVPSESQVQLRDKSPVPDPMWKKFKFDKAHTQNGLFEIQNYSFGIEQTLNIGSQSSGTGAGKVKFNEFTIERKIDKASPLLYTMACSGTPFADVRIGLRKSAGGDQSGITYLVFCFKMVAVKTINWAHDEERPNENVTFEYGGLQLFYMDQKSDGSLNNEFGGGWNAIKNVRDDVANSAPI